MRGPSAQTASIWWAHNRLVVVRLTCTASIRPSRLQIVRRCIDSFWEFFVRLDQNVPVELTKSQSSCNSTIHFINEYDKYTLEIMGRVHSKNLLAMYKFHRNYGANLKRDNWILSGYRYRDSTYSQQDLGRSLDLNIWSLTWMAATAPVSALAQQKCELLTQ